MTIRQPELPECVPAPKVVQLKKKVTVTAKRLAPNQKIEVFLGDRFITTDTTDSSGSVKTDFDIPASFPRGLVPISVRGKTGASNATCAVIVERL
jgi:hypothetical protein